MFDGVMHAIDTNVLVRLIARDDVRQTAAAESFVESGAWVSTLALELFRTKPALGFSNCLMLNLARKAGHLPLGTFNRNLARFEGTRRL
jgi:predicted nucleic acid-binding protein